MSWTRAHGFVNGCSRGEGISALEQKSEQSLQEASAPSLVTALGRQRDCALNEVGGQIGLVAQKRLSGPESGSVSLRMPYDLIDHAHAPTFIMNRN